VKKKKKKKKGFTAKLPSNTNDFARGFATFLVGERGFLLSFNFEVQGRI
jgi:hypothetical protein